ncbi:MAG: Fe-S cluster assembly sulfur transfer protein SufU [Alphaproteobacteria bacterium]
MMDEIRELYQEVILDHGRRPRNLRHPVDATCEARGYNPVCGDKLIVYLKIDDEGIVQDAAFEGNGCAISMASASMMTELVKGRSEAQVAKIFSRFHNMCTSDDDLAEADPDTAGALEKLQVLAGVREYPMRVKCATLAWHAVTAALAGDDEASTE